MSTDRQPTDRSGYVNDPFDSSGVHYIEIDINHSVFYEYIMIYVCISYGWNFLLKALNSDSSCL